MTQASLFGFVGMQCKIDGAEMKQIGSYTKNTTEKKAVVTLWRCTSCLATEKIVAAILMLALFFTLASPARAEPTENECLELFVDEGFGQSETIYSIPGILAKRGITNILTIQEQRLQQAKARTMMA